MAAISSNRRRTAALATVTLSLAALGAQPASRTAPAAAAANRPNVVVILADDMTLRDLYETRGSNGRGKKLMPRTRGLIGGQGITFSRYYSSNPISCPSRTTNLTGQYSKNHGNTRNTFGPGAYCSDPGRVDFARTLPAWLQAAGYRTMHFGRFLNAFGLGRPTRVPAGWDYYLQPVETNISSTAVYYGYRLNVNGVVGPKHGNKHHPDAKNYFTDVITRLALQQIAATDRSQPFFVALDHRAPHEDAVDPVGPAAALRHRRTLRGKPPRHPPSFDERDVSDKTRWLRASRRLNGRQKKLISIRSRRRLRSLIALDQDVATVVRRLRRLGELRSTYIIFTSDNGFFNGEHRISKGKYRPYENSSHVPFMMRGPGIPTGRISRELVMNVDLAPTIVEIAKARPNRVMDGRSLLPFARHPRWRSRRPILLEAYPPRPGTAANDDGWDPVAAAAGGPVAVAAGDPTPPNWKGVVYGRWKLAHYRGQGYELYDLRRDPDELHSLARRWRYRPVLRFLKRQLQRLSRCRGAPCRRKAGSVPKPRPRGRR